MNELAVSLWDRATEALRAGRHLSAVSPDAVASRAYYAAFYAVSALFASEGREFRRHSAVETAVHRDLVKSGRWQPETGSAYSFLAEIRTVGDYGDMDHVTAEQGGQAIQLASDILRVVSQEKPELFPFAGDNANDGPES